MNDCFRHDLIIAKLGAYCRHKSSFKLLSNYLKSRKKMMKIGSSYSLWNDIMKGIPQGSILRHLIYFLLKNLNI